MNRRLIKVLAVFSTGLLIVTLYFWLTSYCYLVVRAYQGKLWLAYTKDHGIYGGLLVSDSDLATTLNYWRSLASSHWTLLGIDFIGQSTLIVLGIPFAYLTIPLAGICAWSIRFVRRQSRRERLGLCMACGYDLRESRGRCPECGTEPVAPKVATEGMHDVVVVDRDSVIRSNAGGGVRIE